MDRPRRPGHPGAAPLSASAAHIWAAHGGSAKLQFVKRSERPRPSISLVLLDWSVRESFHLLHYLEKQTVARELFEVIVVEYYSRVSEALRPWSAQVDTWVLLELPEHCYYHKHLMYNAGIALARGEIVMIGDSDAMVRETFIQTILEAFERDPQIVFHIDQFRNQRRDLYPFAYPTFETVLGDGCSNVRDGQTAGLRAEDDAIHLRNYGACMCAPRSRLLEIGGADMHPDYLGHVCGPYEMTFRLVNLGLREVWSRDEFMYHTWHPGQAGAANHIGPHDGLHVSTTALEALVSGRVRPLLEHPILEQLRQARADADAICAQLVPPGWAETWSIARLESDPGRQWAHDLRPMGTFRGHRLVTGAEGALAFRVTQSEARDPEPPAQAAVLRGPDLDSVRDALRRATEGPLQRLAQMLLPHALAARTTRALEQRLGARGAATRALLGLLGAALTPALLLLGGRDTDRPGLLARLRVLRIRAAADAEQTADLALGLRLLAASGALPANALLVVTSASEHRALRVLRGLGVLPALAVRCAPSVREVEGLLRATAADRRIFLPATAFARFHGSAVETALRERVTVL